MADFYQENFQEYHNRTFQIDSAIFLDSFIQHVEDGSLVLDVGCGSGRDLLWLKEKGYRVLGFERSKGLAELARNTSGAEVVEGDFEKYNFNSLAVDAALMSASLVHLPHKKLQSVLRNIAGAVKPGGVIFISVKEGTGKITDSENRDFYLWEKNDLQNIISSLCFEIIQFERINSSLGNEDVFLSFIVRKTQPSKSS
ncbi:class I SAM-dependent methyltransferase [bacterium]|nr:class I SAM-dependent methyltransferase [bacterium]